eukprot:Seg3647.1 transcript_id=Seg3647.1/GoldUCD/mRNA.D3Y31 product="hypothetical protein" pseudo=true protein_id=Seg3647.1/GoldUCD/D3Y31
MVQTNKVAPKEGEMSALGMLAEMAVKKFKEETEKVDLDRMFGADSTPRKDGKEAAYEVDVSSPEISDLALPPLPPPPPPPPPPPLNER